MLLRAVNRIKNNHEYVEPGEILTVSDKEGKRLLKLKAVEPVKKIVSVELPSSSSKITGQGADTLRELGEKTNASNNRVGGKVDAWDHE